MDKQQLLRETVAQFLKVDAAALTADFTLGGARMHGSLGRAALDAVIRRRLGIQCGAVYSARSYGDLEAAILGKADQPTNGTTSSPMTLGRNLSSYSPEQELQAPEEQGNVSCGVDVEPTRSFAAVPDYREDEFYTHSFTAAEIAYCLMQDQPATHFAARWCAKEALKKCDARFLHELMANIELLPNRSGKLRLHHHTKKGVDDLPHAVSVSHSEELAIAVVMRCSSAVATAAPPIEDDTQTRPAPRSPTLAVLPMLLSLGALAASLWALLRTF